MPSPCRFPPPWSAEVTPNCFIVRDADGQALSYVYLDCSAKNRLPAPIAIPNLHKGWPRSILKGIKTPFTPTSPSSYPVGAFFFEEEPGRRSAAKLLTKDEARRIAANFAKLGALRIGSGPIYNNAPHKSWPATDWPLRAHNSR